MVYDPKVAAAEIRVDVLGKGVEDPRLTVAKSAYEAAEGAHALVIVMEWDEFKGLDYAKIFARMQQPAFVFDGRNILDLSKLRALGFRVSGIGNQPLSPRHQRSSAVCFCIVTAKPNKGPPLLTMERRPRVLLA